MRVFALIVVLNLLGSPQVRTGPQWNAAGWDALRAGKAEEAAADFREALQIDARDALAMLGAGVSAQVRGRSADARNLLSGALRIQPALTAASVLLGELLYREADLQGAIEVYEQALVYASNQPQLTNRLEAWRRESALHDRFSQRVVDHFTILFDGPPDQRLAARVGEILEAEYWRIGGALGAYPTSVVQVVLYTKEQFRDITQSPTWAGGAFDGRVRVPIAGKVDERDLQRVLAHELTHAIVRGVAPRGTPQWLNEGLAVLFEDGDVSRERARLTGKVLIPLERLEKPFDNLSPDEAVLAYAESAVAARKLIDLGGPTAVYNLLTDIANGISFAEAFERAALMPYAEFTTRCFE
jgi:tetratricopeptide (TPR) repeat protein